MIQQKLTKTKTKMILITKTLVIFPYSQQTQQSTTTTSTSTCTTALKDFPLLAAKLAEQEQPSQGHATSAALVIRPIRSHINQYITDIHIRSFAGSAIEFWHQKDQLNIYSVLTLIVQDLVSAPSLQAFVDCLRSADADSRQMQSNG